MDEQKQANREKAKQWFRDIIESEPKGRHVTNVQFVDHPSGGFTLDFHANDVDADRQIGLTYKDVEAIARGDEAVCERFKKTLLDLVRA